MTRADLLDRRRAFLDHAEIHSMRGNHEGVEEALEDAWRIDAELATDDQDFPW